MRSEPVRPVPSTPDRLRSCGGRSSREQHPSNERESARGAAARSSRGVHLSLGEDSKQAIAQLSLLQQALADEKNSCLLPSQPGPGLGNQTGEQSCFRRHAGRSPHCADQPSPPKSHCPSTFTSALCNQRGGSGWKPNPGPCCCQTTSFGKFFHTSKAPTKPRQSPRTASFQNMAQKGDLHF